MPRPGWRMPAWSLTWRHWPPPTGCGSGCPDAAMPLPSPSDWVCDQALSRQHGRWSLRRSWKANPCWPRSRMPTGMPLLHATRPCLCSDNWPTRSANCQPGWQPSKGSVPPCWAKPGPKPAGNWPRSAPRSSRCGARYRIVRAHRTSVRNGWPRPRPGWPNRKKPWLHHPHQRHQRKGSCQARSR